MSENPCKIQKTKVSVCVMTYNQENYVSDCLQSIVDQETNFPFEIIIGDDHSTDGTQEILKKFHEKYPKKIKLILHKENIGVTKNYISIHASASGKYVAHCDGDDFWYSGKLQYQADILDKNPNVSQCWGCADIIDDKGKKKRIFPSKIARLLNPSKITSKHIALSYALVGQHSTQMYRRELFPKLNPNQKILDYWVALKISISGPAIYDKKIVGAYRNTATPSLTRNKDKKKYSVDALAAYLTRAIAEHPELAACAKANLIVRYFFSKLRGHNTQSCKEALALMRNTKTNLLLIIQSAIYFSAQKLKW